MNFLYPAFLIGALTAAIPIVLHFLRRDVAPEVPFSAVRLLRASPIERSRRRRLRDVLLLAARVAALLLLAAAFARPFVAGTAAGSSAIRIVAVDRSFSMGSADGFARALDLARQAVDAARPGERIAVIAFDDRADLIAGPGPAAEARAALATLHPGFGGTRYGALLAKASETADGAPGRLVIVTDLQRAGWEAQERGILPPGFELEVKESGGPRANLAVTNVQVRKGRIVASIHNSGRESHRGRVRVVRESRDVATAMYEVGSEAAVDVPIPYRGPASGFIAVSIDDPAGVPADNTRYAVLDPAQHRAALVVSSGARESGLYLSRALGASAEEGDTETIAARIVADSGLAKMDRGDLARYSAVVLLSTRRLDRDARDSIVAAVRSGTGLLIAAAPDVEPLVVSAMFGWQPPLAGVEHAGNTMRLSATDLRHPVFRPFGALVANLGQVRFDRVWRVRAEGWDVAARFTDGSPALLERREQNGRVVLLASDVDHRWNDFPLHPAFVPFAIEAVKYASGVHDRAQDYIVGRAPEGAEPRPGVYRAGPDGRAVAVNVDPRESGIAALEPGEFESMVDRLPSGRVGAPDVGARQVEARQSYWQYGLLLMIAALVAESFAGRR
jgi:hypothetical protein